MKPTSANGKLKLFGKLMVCVLFISVIFLLFYNYKITKNDAVLAKISQTSNRSSTQKSFPSAQNSTHVINQQYTSNVNCEFPDKQTLANLLTNSTKIQPKENHEKEINKQINVKSISKVSSNIKTEKKSTTQSENKKQENLKVPKPKNQKVVYLTFDDGPQDYSSQILSLLKKYHAKATFFMLDPNIKKYPNAVREMVKNGNSIGSHGVTHDIHKIYRSPAAFVKEMLQTEQTLKRITGKESHLIRVPYGSVPYMTPAFRNVSNSEGFIMWDWDIDSEDWQTNHGEFVQNIKIQVAKASGARPLVVLMHEKASTVPYLEQVLQYFKQSGYKMDAITEDLQPVQFKFRK